MEAIMAKTILTDRQVESLQSRDKAYEINDSACRGLLLRVEKSGTKTFWLYCWTPDHTGKRSRYRWKVGEFPTYRLYGKTPSKAEDRASSVRDVARRLKVQSETEDLRVTRKAAKAAAQADAVATLGSFMDGPYLAYCHEAGMTDPDRTVHWLKSVFSDLLDKPVNNIDYLDIRR
jgi:hypothetical protein